MIIIEKISNFFRIFFKIPTHQTIEENSSSEEKILEENVEEKIDTSKKTLITRLFSLEQEITIFEESFPSKYKDFSERIEFLKNAYNSGLEKLNNPLRFDIDPDLDYGYIEKVTRLEKDVKNFIESDVNFDIMSKHMQRLILKLNILYNVSIFHFKQSEKEKVLLRLNQALEVEKNLLGEFKKADKILSNKVQKERIVSLISYLDYEIFKTGIRNLDYSVEDLINQLAVITEFKGFDYTGVFLDFARCELSNLKKLILLVKDENIKNILKNKIKHITNISGNLNFEILKFWKNDFWNLFLEFESILLSTLKEQCEPKENTVVCIIDKMDISIKEDDVIILPKANTLLSLINLFFKTENEKITLLVKFLKTMPDNINYKEIYFLLLLFDVLDEVKSNLPEITKHINKYIERYNYNSEKINKKKISAFNASNKEYLVMFKFNDFEKEIIKTLDELNFDFKIENDKVLINSLYFKELKNVLKCLKNNN